MKRGLTERFYTVLYRREMNRLPERDDSNNPTTEAASSYAPECPAEWLVLESPANGSEQFGAATPLVKERSVFAPSGESPF